MLHPCSQWKEVQISLCQKSKEAKNKFLGSDKFHVKQQHRDRMFLLSDKKQKLQGTKESWRINYFTDTVFPKWVLQWIGSTYDDIYQEKCNTTFQNYSFSQTMFTEAFFVYSRDCG